MPRGHCIDYWRKWQREGNFCGLREQDAKVNDDYLTIVERISCDSTGLDSDFVFDHFTAGAARPLIRCRDEDVKVKALNYVIACLKRKEDVTGGDLAATIDMFLGRTEKKSTQMRTETPPLPVENDSTPPIQPLKIEPDRIAGVSKSIPEKSMQPSLADQEYLKKYPITAYCLGIGCPEIILHKPGLHLCKVTEMRPENHSRGSCPIPHQHLPSLVSQQAQRGVHVNNGANVTVNPIVINDTYRQSPFKTGAEVMAHDKDPLGIDAPVITGAVIRISPSTGIPIETDKQKRIRLSEELLDCYSERVRLTVTDILRDHPSWNISDVFYFGIEALANSKPQRVK